MNNKTDTIIDYILWRGDLSFKIQPFNTLDAIALCQICYFDMKPYFYDRDKGTIAEIYRYLSDNNCLDCTIVGPDANASVLFQAASLSARFRDIVIDHYIDILNADSALQFAAMNFHIGDKIHYISYRGTDTSLAGWKEDGLMSFRKTESQELAFDYLKSSLQSLLHCDLQSRFLVGGHSKGANLAMYAASMLSKEECDHIERIYVFDGPGFCPDVFDIGRLKAIENKILRVIPEHCIIGKFFDPKIPHTLIVKSTDLGLAQHNMNSWRVDHLKLMTTAETSHASNLLMNAFMEWLSEKNLEEREELVEHFFTALSEDGESKKWGLNIQLPHLHK